MASKTESYVWNEQKHFTQRRKVVEGAKKTKHLIFASLCALVPLCGMRLFVSSLLQIAVCATRQHGQRFSDLRVENPFL